MKRIAHLWIITIIMALILSACGTTNPFIGKWETGEEEEYIEFKKDMTFWAIEEDREPNEVYLLGTYMIDNNNITLLYSTDRSDERIAVASFKVDEGGDLIYVQTPDGNVISLKKAK